MSLVDEAVAAAEKIEGWMNPAELRWLAEQAQSRRRIVEFGAWKGRSTKALAVVAETYGGQVDTFDFFEGYLPDKPSDLLQALDFAVNLQQELFSGTVQAHARATRHAPLVLVTSAQMVFIDAGHSYDAVKQDIRIATYLLRGRGLLCGHDFSNDYPGVQQAVQELVPGYQRAPGGDIWYKELAC